MKYCRTKDTRNPELDLSKISESKYLDLMKLLAADSYTVVEKCWWKNEEINCDGLFQNMWTDVSFCFQFNTNENFVKNHMINGKREHLCISVIQYTCDISF